MDKKKRVMGSGSIAGLQGRKKGYRWGGGPGMHRRETNPDNRIHLNVTEEKGD